jgi:hypothetical protein
MCAFFAAPRQKTGLSAPIPQPACGSFFSRHENGNQAVYDFYAFILPRATSFTATIRKPLTHSESPWAHKGLVEILLRKISLGIALQSPRPMHPGLQRKAHRICTGWSQPFGLLLAHASRANPRTWSGKPGFFAARPQKNVPT